MPWLGAAEGFGFDGAGATGGGCNRRRIGLSALAASSSFAAGVIAGPAALWFTGGAWMAAVAVLASPRLQNARLASGDGPYRDLFDRVSAGLYRTTPDGRFLQANPAFLEMLGIPEDRDIRDVAVEELYVGFDARPAFLSRVDAFDGVTTHEMPVRRSDGVEIWVRDRTRPVFAADGSVAYYDGDLQDITNQRRAEAELRALVDSKSELIAAVSHELRTPLTAILGFLDVLAVSEGLPPEERSELVAVALEQANDMATLVEDLLTSARLENGDLVIAVQPVDVVNAIEAVVETVAPNTPVRLEDGVTRFVWADPVRLRQILRNLVSNAVRHGLPPVEIDVTSGVASLQVAVRDYGAGVAADAEEKMFDAFFSGSEARSRPGSIGLGLAVSRRLARLMGGDLGYRRREGETSFVLELPAGETSGVAA